MHNDLWGYACERYARPGVEASCLAAQAAGSNVCLALCAAWLDQRGVEWQPVRAEALEAAALLWSRDVVEPLRALRQQWRAAAQEDAELARLRSGVKQLELDAERNVLVRLEQAALTWPQGEAAHPQWLAWAVPDPVIRAALSTALGGL